MAEGCKDNPSTAFYKNRVKDSLETKLDTISVQKKDTASSVISAEVSPVAPADSLVPGQMHSKDSLPDEAVQEVADDTLMVQ